MLVLILGLLPSAIGQIAITEVMSEASDAILPKRPDFWELTNFGSARVDLSPYRWSDSAGFEAAEPRFFEGRSIGPGESIVLVRSNVVTTLSAQHFYDWWGLANLPQPLQILFYRGPGFSQDYDAVQLWKVTATSTSLVDRVDFYVAAPGLSFTYDSNTGLFDALSRAGVQGAFRAAAGLDIGSPGLTTGPVPLRILEPPDSVEVDAGSSVTFSVRAQGLPKPRYQWRLNSAPILGATDALYTIPNALISSAGLYSVQLDNGLESRVSPSAELKVSAIFSCARIVRPPADLELTPGQDALFSVQARGFPLPTFQWQFNGVNILGATNSTFSVPSVTPTLSGTLTVQVANPLCSTYASATLLVSPPPDLSVTEVMAAASTNSPFRMHGDWWELTNFGSNVVSLHGYRFDDAPGVISGAVIITNGMVMQPGESVVFISDMSREDFVSWWGAENLPESLQIMMYPGNSFDALGDALYLWNATATVREDVILSLSFVTDTRGVSLWFDPILSEFGEPSVVGERGAFRAAQSDDVGSPGWIGNPPPRLIPPRILSVEHGSGGVTLIWSTQAGQTYEVQSSEDLNQEIWVSLHTFVAEEATLSTTDRYGQSPHRFYRVVARSPSP